MTQTFELNMDYLPGSLFTFIPGIVGIAIFIYVWFKIPNSATTTAFLVFIISCSVWQIAEGFLRISANEAGALFWNRCISMIITTIVISGFHFALLFTNQKKTAEVKVIYGSDISARFFLFYCACAGVYFVGSSA